MTPFFDRNLHPDGPCTEPMILLPHQKEPCSFTSRFWEYVPQTSEYTWQARCVATTTEDSSETLLAHLKSSHWKQRVQALRALAAHGQSFCLQFLPLVQEALHDSIDVVRVTAVETLAVLEDKLPLHPLLRALHDPSWEVRATAARILGHLGDDTPIQALMAAFQEDDDENVREAIIRALGNQREHMPIPFLCRILRFDTNWIVREAAAWAIGQLEEDAPLSPLLEALHYDSDETVKAAVIRALGRAGHKQAEEALFFLLEEEEEEIREAVVWALQQLDEETRGLQRQEESWSHPLHDVVLKLTDFMKEKKGYIEAPILHDTASEQILVIECKYQSRERLCQQWSATTTDAIVQSIEKALWQHDEIVHQLVEHAAQEWEIIPWHDFMILSFTLSASKKIHTCNHKPLRVVFASTGYTHTQGEGSLLLPQLLTMCEAIAQNQRIVSCVHKHQMEDLHIWHQSAVPQHTLR